MLGGALCLTTETDLRGTRMLTRTIGSLSLRIHMVYDCWRTRVFELKRPFFLDLSVVDRRSHDDLRKIYSHSKAPRFHLRRPRHRDRLAWDQNAHRFTQSSLSLRTQLPSTRTLLARRGGSHENLFRMIVCVYGSSEHAHMDVCVCVWLKRARPAATLPPSLSECGPGQALEGSRSDR